MGELGELLRASHEVGFAVHFDHHTDAAIAMRIYFDDAVGCLAVGTLGSRFQTFLTQEFNRLLYIAFRSLQGFTAVHDASLGDLTQFLDHLSCNFHACTSVHSSCSSSSSSTSFISSSSTGSSALGAGAILARVEAPSSLASSSSSSIPPRGATLEASGSAPARRSRADSASSSSSLRIALPSSSASAILATISLMARMASSLDGMT